MLRKLIAAIAHLLGFDAELNRKRSQEYGLVSESVTKPKELLCEKSYKLLEFSDRASATKAAKQYGIAVLLRGEMRPKWLFFTCPCGCGQEIALNLMVSHKPNWRVEIDSLNSFSVYPSVDSTKCGAHFFLKDGKVIWCE